MQCTENYPFFILPSSFQIYFSLWIPHETLSLPRVASEREPAGLWDPVECRENLPSAVDLP